LSREAPVGYQAREIALERILAQAMRFPDLDFSPHSGPPVGADGSRTIDPRDGALARAIEHAVVRRYLTLIACVRPHLAKNWPLLEKPIQAALLAGAAQILFLDRVPAAAAVDASVEWTKRRLRPGAGGLVNAVLRKVAGSVVERVPAGDPMLADHTRRDLVPLADGSALRLSVEAFSEDAAQSLAEKTSHARDLVLHWIGAFGFKEATRLAMHDLVEAPLIVTPFDALDARFEGKATPHADAGFGVWTGSHAELTALLGAHADLRVQDPTSCATVAFAGAMLAKKPSIIVDLCAGRGTKTRQLAALYPGATVLATDPDRARFASLQSLAASNPRVRALHPQELFREAAGRANLVLLDVPCSNSGVLARRPEARYRFSKARTKSVLELQQKIADPAIGLVAPKGAVLYATCSIERGENEAQVKRLASNFGLSLVVERTIMPAGLPGEPASLYRDGGYHALLARA
jgi:16S rRNA (cytosine967-C5)-methyltransferase